MEVELASKAGFCFGVRRAVKMARRAAAQHRGIFSLGPLIHNRQVVESLASEGVVICNAPEELQAGGVIVPSHGITLEERRLLERNGLKVIDATCPFVRYPQKLCRDLSRRKYFVVIVGDPGHREVSSLQSHVEGPSVVVPSVDQLPRMHGVKRAAVIAQTTQSERRLIEVAAALVSRVKELLVVNTICSATAERQASAMELAARVGAVVVVGGFDSANTNRLFELCSQIQPASYHIETAAELRKEWFAGCRGVGVTAGASTPDWVIEEVVDRLKLLDKQ